MHDTASVYGWSGELLLRYSKDILNHHIGFGIGYRASVNVGGALAFEAASLGGGAIGLYIVN